MSNEAQKRLRVITWKESIYLKDMAAKQHAFSLHVAVVSMRGNSERAWVAWTCEGLSGAVAIAGDYTREKVTLLVTSEAQRNFLTECYEWHNHVGEAE